MISDKLGIVFSSLCLCHCLLTPLLILLLGTNALLGTLEHEWVHKIFLLPVLFIAAISLPKRYFATRNQTMLGLAIVGICAFVVAQFFHGMPEVVLTMIGSIGIISAHLLSLRLTKQRKTLPKTLEV
jgi:NhaP-type Na+/H+ or K+/H+ antiporter